MWCETASSCGNEVASIVFCALFLLIFTKCPKLSQFSSHTISNYSTPLPLPYWYEGGSDAQIQGL